jgi:hypothetical protein
MKNIIIVKWLGIESTKDIMNTELRFIWIILGVRGIWEGHGMFLTTIFCKVFNLRVIFIFSSSTQLDPTGIRGEICCLVCNININIISFKIIFVCSTQLDPTSVREHLFNLLLQLFVQVYIVGNIILFTTPICLIKSTSKITSKSTCTTTSINTRGNTNINVSTGCGNTR